MSALAIVPVTPETDAGLSRRLAELLDQSESESTQGQLPDATREQAAGLVEVLRRRIVRKPDPDHRSLFDLDDRLIELMGLVEEAADAGGEISKELAQEMTRTWRPTGSRWIASSATGGGSNRLPTSVPRRRRDWQRERRRPRIG